ncbi:hypothetical protein [Sporosarcina sp. NPDC096371]|uniref:hypothetical protein n=1 Tax=Sporosarcina sp. NPDC096371 TaxID=3364530 RepID=UPI00382E6EBD
MKTRKGRLILLGANFLIFVLLNISYFSNDFYTPQQDAQMTKLMVYVFFMFVFVLFGEWFGTFDEDCPRLKKYLFRSVAIIWVLFLLILVKNMIFG